MTDQALNEIIKTAIQREIEAQELYLAAVDMVKEEHLQELLRDLAAQEVGHQKKLETLLAGKLGKALSSPLPQVVDHKITDYLVEVPLSPNADFQDILIVAGKREKASHALYSSMAEATGDGVAADLFRLLADQELSHKERIETLYEKVVYDQNWVQKPNSQDHKQEEKNMAKYECLVCGWIYDPAVGDPDSGIEPGTAFEDIPEDWVCPECGAGKDMFEKAE